MSRKPLQVASLHRAICARENCPHLDHLDYAANCAFCPAGHWGTYDCAEPNDLRSAPLQVSSFSFQVSPPSLQPWPLLLRPLKLLARPDDNGLGDIIARTIGPIGGATFKAWHLKIFGQSCGCTQRQEDWNRQYPLQRP